MSTPDSGVMPAQGASSSQPSRRPRTAASPNPARVAASTSRAKRRRSVPYPSGRVLVSPERKWRRRLKDAAFTSTPSRPLAAAMAAAVPNPSTTAAMSSSSISWGTSRLTGSATRDGAHRTAWLYALDPWPPQWPIDASASDPCRCSAAATPDHPAKHSAARGARS